MKEFHSEHCTTVRATSIKEPLFLLDDEDPSPFTSPLSSLTSLPCPTPVNYPEESSLTSEVTKEPSLLGLTAQMEMPFKYSSHLSTDYPLTPNSYGPYFGPTTILTTLTSPTLPAASMAMTKHLLKEVVMSCLQDIIQQRSSFQQQKTKTQSPPTPQEEKKPVKQQQQHQHQSSPCQQEILPTTPQSTPAQKSNLWIAAVRKTLQQRIATALQKTLKLRKVPTAKTNIRTMRTNLTKSQKECLDAFRGYNTIWK